MSWRNKFLFLRQRGGEKEEKNTSFLQNGSALLEGLITCSNGTYNVPLRSFSAEQLEKATNSFADDFQTHFHTGRFSYICKGSLEGRPILVNWYNDTSRIPSDAKYNQFSAAVRNIVVTAQMSRHNNVLKLLGCCLESKHAALVYEYSGNDVLLSDILYSASHSLSWRSRFRIAISIANAILYLHTEFSTPVIYRILNPTNVVVNQTGCDARLFDFSYCISLPRGKLEVEDDLIRITGYIDPEYHSSKFATQKTDVYSFGVLLLVLLTRQPAACVDREGNRVHIVSYVGGIIAEDRFAEIADPEILLEIGVEQLKDFVNIALRCVEYKGEYRPNMIDVAKQLRQIKRSA